MVIDLKAYRQKGRYSGDFRFEYEADDGLLPFPDGKLGTAVVEGAFEIDGDDVFVSGKLAYTVFAPCARCLAPSEQSVEVEFDEKFSKTSSDEGYTYERDKIDLKKMVDDLILSESPISVYCSPDCKGLCPVCGAKISDGGCKCTPLNSETR